MRAVRVLRAAGSARPGRPPTASGALRPRTIGPVARAWLAVGVGVLGISLAAPIGAATAAPALAVAFWRSAGGALATVPVVAVGSWALLRRASSRASSRASGGGGCVGSGGRGGPAA